MLLSIFEREDEEMKLNNLFVPVVTSTMGRLAFAI
jgi:hypothetical protein